MNPTQEKMKTTLTKDLDKKKLLVKREFAAAPDVVWRAWTDPKILDQWWAPKPWKAVTVSQDFKNGGRWMYYMQGPDRSRHYCIADYTNIVPQKSYEGLDAFTDENGNIKSEMPRMKWKVNFVPVANGTRVDIEISFDRIEDLNKIIEMGFEEGFAMAHNNLDEILAK